VGEALCQQTAQHWQCFRACLNLHTAATAAMSESN